MARVLARPLRFAGFELEVRSFYSPIPDLAKIDRRVWTEPSELSGLRGFELPAQLIYIERELGEWIAQFRPPQQATNDRFEFHLRNGLYQGGDADLLYAMIRRHRPKRVIEFGAGFSTLVTAAACRDNRAAGHDTDFVSYDPFAVPPPSGLDGLSAIIPASAESAPIDALQALAENDILFIDSSHVVRVGGDVIHLLLEVVPRLQPGVLIHVHDIFLPWEYPRQWAVNGWFWTEQHLLQALLVGNPGLEVLVAAYALWRSHPVALTRLIPNIDPAHPPMSFWMRRL